MPTDQPAGPATTRRTAWIIAVLGVVLLAVAIAVWSPWSPRAPQGPGAAGGAPSGTVAADDYPRLVAAFSIAVAALDVEENDRARDQLLQASTLAPREPAVWANLGLAEVRLGNMDAAATALATARQLAPDSSHIIALAGLTESRRGNFEGAAELLRKASELNPQDLRSRIALVRELERQNTPQAEGQMLEILRAAHAARPDNTAVTLELLRVAARQQDLNRVRQLVAELEPLTTHWPPAVLQRFASLKQAVAAETSDPAQASAATKAAGREVAFLRNLLVNDPTFRDHLAELETPVSQIGHPLTQFMTLPPPPPMPAPRDEQVAYAAQSIGAAPVGAVSYVRTVWPTEGGDPLILGVVGQQIVDLRAGSPKIDLAGRAAPAAIVPADLNYDFTTDLLVAGPDGAALYWQGGDGTYTAAAGPLASADIAGTAYAGAWACDIDLDGDLDMVLAPAQGAPVVLRNNGDQTFERIDLFADVPSLRDFVWFDIDADGDPDAAMIDAAGALHVRTNERSNRFVAREAPQGAAPAAALVAADMNQDAAVDLVVLKADGQIARVSDQDEARWQVAMLPQWQGLAEPLAPGAAQLRAADLDNNGGLDLVASAGSRSQAWLSDEKGAFHGMAPLEAAVADIADLTGDGRLDLVGTSAQGSPVLLAASGGHNYHWQSLRARATQTSGDQRINSFGVGSEVEVRAGLLVQKQIVAHGPVHFGLGDHPRADITRILWPNGVPQVEFIYEPDRLIVAEQRLKGSCPFLFAFDGEQVRFVTDILWRSPLGLKINAVDTAQIMQTEDWVKVRGDQLAPTKDGTYDLRITADLWETHFFDQVALMVVDHPTGTEAWVDERFARVSPELKVTITGPLSPLIALDHRGQDVSDFVRNRDLRYLGGFSKGMYQGIAEDHWVELTLPASAPSDRPLVLVAQGWIHPTDSSINVAISQGRHEPPRGLSVEVPGGAGGWRVVRDDVGFPAGKLKTILLPLSDLWPAGAERKLRLRTNLEIYWDRLAVAEVLDVPPTSPQRLAAQSADLQYRGISRIEAADEVSPELPSYDDLETTGQKWLDLVGFYTRFGDVRELLEAVDDRYVILNAGDEIRLRFAAAPPPAEGMIRDFVFVSDGWEKDGDYSTAFSKTVLPLPRHDWPAYDRMWPLEQDPAYLRNPDDWVNYHTRYVTPSAFRRALVPTAN